MQYLRDNVKYGNQKSGFEMPYATTLLAHHTDVADLLTLKSLRTLIAVAHTHSLTRAGVELGLAQSAVSRQIAELERALGGALFYRTGRGVQATDLLTQVLPRVQHLLANADALAQTSRELASTPSGLVKLGLVPGVAGLLAAPLYGVITRRYPQVRLRIIEGYSGDMEIALTQGKIDLAILNRYRAKGSNSYRRLFASQLCIVGRSQFLQRALAPKPRYSVRSSYRTSAKSPQSRHTAWQTLTNLPLVLPVPPNAIRNLLDEISERRGLKLDLICEASSSVIIKSMLAQHDCASILPRHAIADELRARTLDAVPLSEKVFTQHIVLATSAQHPFTQASKAVAAFIPGIVAAVLEAPQP